MVQEYEGFRTVAYFVNWAIYARQHNPQDLPVKNLTHVLYAFANVKPDSGEVYLTDTWSDIEKHYPSDSWNEPTPGPHIYGCLKQLALLKRRNRNLKTLLSIGGWTHSRNFASGASTASRRRKFAETAVVILKDCGFDGLDVDWEYPKTDIEAANYVEILREIRQALETYESNHSLRKNKLLLTVACPARPSNFNLLRIKEMDKYLDFWNLMAYDFAGAWDSLAAHQANIYPLASNSPATPFSAKAAIDHYTWQGVDKSRIVLGCPLYGRAFVDTKGPGHAYDGGVGDGSWERGIWDWKVLPPGSPSCQVLKDRDAIASYSYDHDSRTMVSFDSRDIMKHKARWIKEHALGGMMWWESSGDKKEGEGSAIEAAAYEFGDGKETKFNLTSFPDSKFRNLREGFPREISLDGT